MEANDIALPEDTNTQLIMAGEEETRNKHVKKILHISRKQKRVNLEANYQRLLERNVYWEYNIDTNAYALLSKEEKNTCEAMILERARIRCSRAMKAMWALSSVVCAGGLFFDPLVLILLLFTIFIPLSETSDDRDILSKKKGINLLLSDE